MQKANMKYLISLFLGVVFSFTGCTTSEPTPSTFRVLSYNIHHGEGIDGKIDLQRIAAFIKDSKADIVGLQEIDRGVERTARRDFPRELAKLTGMKVYFERNIIYDGGDYGNAVLTRFPIKKKKNTHYKMLREGEQRGVIQLVLDVYGRDLLFMNTHIDYRPDDSERLINADELKKIVAGAGNMPVILCGDFNDNPGSPTHEKMKSFLSDTWELIGQGNGFSYPTGNPEKRIDYIWVSNGTVEPVKIEVLKSDASDHLPVLGEFRFR
jgi:endonuclease/exonuclease/phosphatase family metal-dependent hydrolase